MRLMRMRVSSSSTRVGVPLGNGSMRGHTFGSPELRRVSASRISPGVARRTVGFTRMLPVPDARSLCAAVRRSGQEVVGVIRTCCHDTGCGGDRLRPEGWIRKGVRASGSDRRALHVSAAQSLLRAHRCGQTGACSVQTGA